MEMGVSDVTNKGIQMASSKELLELQREAVDNARDYYNSDKYDWTDWGEIKNPDVENLIGMDDQLNSPAFCTSVGLLRWGTLMSEIVPQSGNNRYQPQNNGKGIDWENVKNWLKRLLP